MVDNFGDSVSLPLCAFCAERETKYSCVNCNEVVCNICANAAPEHSGYDEENKRVGICEKCVVMGSNADSTATNVDANTSDADGDTIQVSKSVSTFMSGPKKAKDIRSSI